MLSKLDIFHPLLPQLLTLHPASLQASVVISAAVTKIIQLCSAECTFKEKRNYFKICRLQIPSAMVYYLKSSFKSVYVSKTYTT